MILDRIKVLRPVDQLEYLKAEIVKTISDRLREADISSLVAAYCKGTSARDLAERFETSKSSVKTLLRKRGVRPMPLSLAGDLEEVDLGWAVVELAVVGSAFEAVVVGSVSFDHSGICSVSSWWVGSFGDFVGGFGEGGGECFRGKSPPGW